MKYLHTNLATMGISMLIVIFGFVACTPATTPAPPTIAPTQPPAPTTAPPTAAPTTAPTAEPIAAAEVTLQVVANDALGKFLADGDGNTLYLFTKDTKDTSNCYDKCEQNWPPLLTTGEPTLLEGVNEALIGTTERTDGSTQLTYNGWPLYHFASDQAAGDTTGQAVGDVWWVISGEGNPIKPASLQMAQNDALGAFLADGAGNTLYLFAKDTKDTSNCYDKCEQNWPPLLALGDPDLQTGVNSALVGTTQRTDGTTQLTYNGWPLYYFAADEASGDATGQAVGDVWWVVSGEGNPIKPAALQIVQNDTLGQFLADGEGNTLYLFTKDSKDTTVCYDKCEQNWPPLLTLGDPTVLEGVDAAMLGTTQRKDGTTQLTYNGWPLYYFAADEAPGDATGQGVGEVWYVVTPAGEAAK